MELPTFDLHDPLIASLPGDVRVILDVEDGTVWTADRGGSISVYDEATGAQLHTITHDMQCPLDFALVGPNEVWAGRADGNIIIFDRESRVGTTQVMGHTGGVFTLLSDSMGSVYSGGADWKIKQWAAETHEVRLVE